MEYLGSCARSWSFIESRRNPTSERLADWPVDGFSTAETNRRSWSAIWRAVAIQNSDWERLDWFSEKENHDQLMLRTGWEHDWVICKMISMYHEHAKSWRGSGDLSSWEWTKKLTMRKRGEIYHKARSEEEKASPMSHWFIPLILTKLSGRSVGERVNGVSNGLDIRNKLRRRSNYIEGWTTEKSEWNFQARVN